MALREGAATPKARGEGTARLNWKTSPHSILTSHGAGVALRVKWRPGNKLGLHRPKPAAPTGRFKKDTGPRSSRHGTRTRYRRGSVPTHIVPHVDSTAPGADPAAL